MSLTTHGNKIGFFLALLYLCPTQVSSVCLRDSNLKHNGRLDTPSWDVHRDKPEDPDAISRPYWERRGYYEHLEEYGYLLPSDPTYGLPAYKKTHPMVSYDDDASFYYLRPYGRARNPQGFTPQQMADYVIKKVKQLVQHLKAAEKMREELLKKPMVTEYTEENPPAPEKSPSENAPSDQSTKGQGKGNGEEGSSGENLSQGESPPNPEGTATPDPTIPQESSFDGLVLAARNALGHGLAHYLFPLYGDLKTFLYDCDEVIVGGPHLEVKTKVAPEVWKPLLKKIRASKPVSRHWGSLPASERSTAHEVALAHYWVEELEPVLQQIDNFLDTYELRGTRHGWEYTPPVLDLTRNYWKNILGQWCSGYGVIFEKRVPNAPHDPDNKNYGAAPLSHPLLRKEPLTDATDYEELPQVKEGGSTSHIAYIPSDWFKPKGEWTLFFSSKNKGEKPHPGREETKALEDLDMWGAMDLIHQLKIMVEAYKRAYTIEQEHIGLRNTKDKSWTSKELITQNRVYGQPLRGHRDQITQFILQIVGPYYDNIKETLTLAEKTLRELGQDPEVKKPFFTFTKVGKKGEPVKASLLKQDSKEKKLAAAHHILEKLRPVEKVLDAFLDEHIFLRGVVCLFDMDDRYEDPGAYHWKNAHGYPCRGFGRLLSPRIPRPPMEKKSYYEHKGALAPMLSFTPLRVFDTNPPDYDRGKKQ